MNLSGRLRWMLVAWLGVLAWLVPAIVTAGEPFQAFLNGLRERQMFDMALEYLEQSKTNPLVSDADRQRIPYEQGRVLVDEAATIRDLGVRNQRLDEAQNRFEAFINENPDHPVAAEAGLQVGTVLVERGRVALGNAKLPRNAANRAQLVSDARSRFEQAQQVFTKSETRFAAEFEKFPNVIDPKDKAKIEQRNQARLNLIQAQMLSATVLYDLTKTLDVDAPKRKSQLEAAAAKYESIYKSYPTLLVGLYARMHQAQSLLDLGDVTNAVTYLDEVLAQAGSQRELRGLYNKSLPLAMRGWQQMQELDRIVELGNSWQSDATRLERQTAEGLSITWFTAQALRQRVANAGDKAGRGRDADLRQAARLAADVARVPGDYQDDARALVSELRKTAVDTAEPKTFAEALTQGKTAIDEIGHAAQELKQAAGDRDKQAELQQAKTDAVERATQSFATAQSLRGGDESSDELNELRYYQAYLNYLQERYYDAAVLGEFIARRYPDTAFARQSARIALAAYLQAYNAQSETMREFETERLANIAEFIGERWREQPEAAEAWMLLGDVAIRAGDMQRATEYLARIPEDSPQRSEADLKQGQAIWSRYLDQQRVDPASDRLDEMLATARAMLEQGVERGRSSAPAPSFNVLAAELTLAQIYNNELEYDKALELLGRENSGPLVLVAANDPIATRGNFAGEALKAALRSYVGAQRLEQAESVMDQLEKHYAGSATGEAQLTAIYVGLGRELETQVKSLQAEGKQEQLAEILDGFQLFLDRIAQRDVATPSTLLWVGETYYRLATGVGDGAAQTAQARSYFDKSSAAYESLLKLGETDPKLQQGQAAVRLRLARTYRGAGKYQPAIEQLMGVLAENPNVLECQLEAAQTYAQWGATDPQRYQLAINGSEKDKIWGFNGIRRRLQNVAKFKAQYEEARFQVAECSYRLALSKQGSERAESLSAVERLIQSFARLDPELGGSERRDQYDRLLKDVQRAAGRQPEGLSTIPSAATARTQNSPAS